jgi:hypothetical protein
MGQGILIVLFSILVFSKFSNAQSVCQIFSSQGRPAPIQNDEFYKILSKSNICPQNIDAVNAMLNSGFQNRKFLVANRGRNNPKLGSFSVFETFASNARSAEAGIFLGHFTQLKNQNGQNVIDLDQAPEKGKLVIELIAWDEKKGFYNFYELIGQGGFSQWFYRGDSKDILLDNQAIYLNNTPQMPPIGQRLRCSGCHTSGGPIMKELEFPHNDWWVKSRPLVFENKQSESFLQRLRVIDTAENLSLQVKSGIHRLEKSSSYQNIKRSLGIQVQLRPLFCDLEINIESDSSPLQSATNIQIPSSSISGAFSGPLKYVISKSTYMSLLQKHGMKFPENGAQDADHAWLTPVKGYSDLMAISSLKQAGLVDDKTILDIQLSAAVGSLMNKERCDLLKLVPNISNWKQGFLQNLKLQNSKIAQSLYQRMNNPALTVAAYQTVIKSGYQQAIQKMNSAGIDDYFVQLLKNRNAVFQSEISKNPRGQILEPGFRLIFPVKNL